MEQIGIDNLVIAPDNWIKTARILTAWSELELEIRTYYPEKLEILHELKEKTAVLISADGESEAKLGQLIEGKEDKKLPIVGSDIILQALYRVSTGKQIKELGRLRVSHYNSGGMNLLTSTGQNLIIKDKDR